MVRVAEWCVKSVQISKRIQTQVGKKLVDFITALAADAEVAAEAKTVKEFSTQFSIPGSLM
jgi:hypothetical protein